MVTGTGLQVTQHEAHLVLLEDGVLRHQPHGPSQAAVPDQGLGPGEGVEELEELQPGHLPHVAQLDTPDIGIGLSFTHHLTLNLFG